MPIEENLLLVALTLAALGGVGGLLAGLFGIGGGVVAVPGMYFIFSAFGYEETAMHMAVGTSLATIIWTGSASAWAHYKQGALDISLVRRLFPGACVGAALGSVVAGLIDVFALTLVFAVAQISMGLYLLVRPNRSAIVSSLPGPVSTSLIQSATACLTTLMGVGGGVQNVLFMTLCNVPIRRAVSVASGLGVILALLGASGFVVIGWGQEGLPPYSFGYVVLPAWACIVVTSVLTAPVGARLSHRVSVGRLKQGFSILVMVVAVKMMAEVLFGL